MTIDRIFRVLRNLAWPKLDLGIRLWLAQAFFVSGVLKLTHWQTALDLATNEYPVSWMSPVAAAYTGVSIELIGATLLAAGLMTRYAALPMLILTLVAQLAYLPFDNQLFWAAFLGWYVVEGAGPWSIDHLIRRGLADSALPLVPLIIRASAWVRRHAAPLYVSALRIWLGSTLLIAAIAPQLMQPQTASALQLWLPLRTAAPAPPALALIAGAVLLLGLATRYVCGLLILSTFAGSMIDPRMTDSVYLLMLFAVFIAFGAGPASFDQLIGIIRRKRRATGAEAAAASAAPPPRVVIIGAGFGGVSCATALRKTRASVTVIDRANHHLFQPLLYQVATAGLSPGDIAAPVRPMFRDAPNVQVLLSTVTAIDTGKRLVSLQTKQVPYDYLVIATGAAHSYFGKDQWAPFAPGLKRVEDATEIRRRILTAFERAEVSEDAAERDSLLTFLIVGGGPTGVELAGAIAELARFGMDKEFRNFDPAQSKVILVQSAPRLLPSFPERLAAIATLSLQRLGVTVMLGSRVENIDADGVVVSGRRVASKTVLWAAGVMASPAAKWLEAAADNAGRVKVGPGLEVPGLTNVFAIGDTAASSAWRGEAVPGLAPAAKQGGQHVARRIAALFDGLEPPAAFEYRHLGSLATIGRKAAVADFGFMQLWGAPAWWLWGLIHIGFLVGLRNRAATMINWFWAYLTFGGGIRLITGGDLKPTAPP